MSANGKAERANTKARLEQMLPGVPIFRGIPDITQLGRAGVGGYIKPYVVLKFAGPVPTARDRRIAVGEEQQPQIMVAMAVAYASSVEIAEDTAGDVVDALLGWAPSDTNSTQYKAAGGYAFTTMSPTNKQSRFEEAVSFQTILNQDDGD